MIGVASVAWGGRDFKRTGLWTPDWHVRRRRLLLSSTARFEVFATSPYAVEAICAASPSSSVPLRRRRPSRALQVPRAHLGLRHASHAFLACLLSLAASASFPAPSRDLVPDARTVAKAQPGLIQAWRGTDGEDTGRDGRQTARAIGTGACRYRLWRARRSELVGSAVAQLSTVGGCDCGDTA